MGKRKDKKTLWKGFEYKPPYWENEFQYVKTCSEAFVPAVVIKWNAFLKILSLMKKIKGIEWAADLMGKQNKNSYIIEDLYIFEQEVTSVSVTRKEAPSEGCIGVIHSHHTMGAFMSHVDEEYANNNHSLSGVVSLKRGAVLPVDIKFTVRVKVPCGKFLKVENVEPRIEFPEVEVDTSKIKEKKLMASYFESYKGKWIDTMYLEPEKLEPEELGHEEEDFIVWKEWQKKEEKKKKRNKRR